MKKQNHMDEKAKAPDPDDLTSEFPDDGRDREEWDGPRGAERPETRRNRDVSAPHVPPPHDE
jgi:hypothetical protein